MNFSSTRTNCPTIRSGTVQLDLNQFSLIQRSLTLSASLPSTHPSMQFNPTHATFLRFDPGRFYFVLPSIRSSVHSSFRPFNHRAKFSRSSSTSSSCHSFFLSFFPRLAQSFTLAQSSQLVQSFNQTLEGRRGWKKTLQAHNQERKKYPVSSGS